MNISGIKNRFPIFSHHPDLVYLDSAATALKPRTVIDAVSEYYERYSTNVGRGLYPLAEETTARIEDVRVRTARFIGADPDEIVFTRNTTESINLLASVLEDRISAGDTIVATGMEHHSNYLPWEWLARKRGAELRIVPFDKNGTIDPAEIAKYMNARTKIFAFTAVSNVLGTINPPAAFIAAAKVANPNVLTVIDAAQAVGHCHLDVRKWGCDFLAFSGHKLFGPTGIGILYGEKALIETIPPYQVGGGMVEDACARVPELKPAPYRLEAGTPDIAAIIGFGTAIDFVNSIGIDAIREHEQRLVKYALEKLEIEFGESIRILGPTDPEKRDGLVSFSLSGIHPHDLAQILGESGICIRAGEHCAAPLHRSLGLTATARISFSIYNDERDIDALIEAMKNALATFK